MATSAQECAKQSRTRQFHALHDRIYRSDPKGLPL